MSVYYLYDYTEVIKILRDICENVIESVAKQVVGINVKEIKEKAINDCGYLPENDRRTFHFVHTSAECIYQINPLKFKFIERISVLFWKDEKNEKEITFDTITFKPILGLQTEVIRNEGSSYAPPSTHCRCSLNTIFFDGVYFGDQYIEFFTSNVPKEIVLEVRDKLLKDFGDDLQYVDFRNYFL